MFYCDFGSLIFPANILTEANFMCSRLRLLDLRLFRIRGEDAWGRFSDYKFGSRLMNSNQCCHNVSGVAYKHVTEGIKHMGVFLVC